MPEPRIGFLIGGVQKAGTTALALYLAAHPGLALPSNKEAHVFDNPDFNDAWTAAEVDARSASHFGSDAGECGDAGSGEVDAGGAESGSHHRLHGDATPITLFHPTLVARVARYNPAMRWVILLRDPVERAISHHAMERARGHERRALLPAVLLERSRLRGRWDDWAPESPLRVCSYAARGRYARQLDCLFAHFPRGQVLCLRSADLAAHPFTTVGRVLAFLGVPALLPALAPARVFAGRYRPPPAWAPGRLALRLLLRGEKAELRRRHGIDLDAPVREARTNAAHDLK